MEQSQTQRTPLEGRTPKRQRVMVPGALLLLILPDEHVLLQPRDSREAQGQGSSSPEAEERGLLGHAGQEAVEELGDGEAPGRGTTAQVRLRECRPALTEVDSQGGQAQHV